MHQQIKLTALRPLCGDYGTPDAGQAFTTDSRTAESLMSRGLAERYRDRRVTAEFLASLFRPNGKMTSAPENKMVVAPENKADKPKRTYTKRSERWLSRA